MFISLSKRSLEQCFYFTPVIGVFVYHECTMQRHAEMGDVLTDKLLKKTENTLNKYYFTYIRTPQTANFQERKKRDLRIYDPFAMNKIKLKFY